MANDFSGDSNCIALWNLDDGELETDSKGTNTLANTGVDADTGDYKQGDASAEFVRASSDRLKITDADLDSGYPLKNGESNKTFSYAFWFKPATMDIDHYLIDKTTGADRRQFIIGLNDANRIELSISVDGAAWDINYHGSALSTGIWYHVGVTYDNSDYSIRIRIWDDNAEEILGVDLTDTLTDVYITDASIYLGYSSSALTLDGKLDEVVCFDDVLSVADIDAIRAGTYGGGPSQTVLDYERKTRGVARGVMRGAA